MTNLPNNTPSEQPANAQASPSPSRQSLESEMDEIFTKVRWGDYQREDGSWGFGVANKTELIPALLKTVDLYVEERERLARIDELQRLALTAGVNIEVDAYVVHRLEALRQQVKGGE